MPESAPVPMKTISGSLHLYISSPRDLPLRLCGLSFPMHDQEFQPHAFAYKITASSLPSQVHSKHNNRMPRHRKRFGVALLLVHHKVQHKGQRIHLRSSHNLSVRHHNFPHKHVNPMFKKQTLSTHFHRWEVVQMNTLSDKVQQVRWHGSINSNKA